ncbi:hypothetical protein SNE40_000446 [Patella caerulea]|uniref:Uncharacterized protein n=1 Tax=Patella caerulea TaxID=87958 RepID=A0AAN8KC87_PATCE
MLTEAELGITVAAVIVGILAIVMAIVYLYRTGQFQKFLCWRRKTLSSRPTQSNMGRSHDPEVNGGAVAVSQSISFAEVALEEPATDTYCYDEVYCNSEFQDRKTKLSIKQLYSITSDYSSLVEDDDDETPDLVFK